MRGHIVKRGKDSYTIVLSLGTDPATGKRKQRWVSIKGGKRAAERHLAELLHQFEGGTLAESGRTTVGVFLGRWLEEYARHNLSPRGFERYASVVWRHLVPGLGGIELARLRPEQLQRHYAAKLAAGLSAGSVRYQHAVLHVALATALRWGLIARNPADAIDLPRVRRSEMQTWDEDEVACFLDAAQDSPYYALFYLALFTGMRRSELLALRWSDLDLSLGQASVERGLHQFGDGSYAFTEVKSAKSRRTIALPPSAALMLRGHRERQEAVRAALGASLRDSDLVFATLEGKPLRPNTVTRAWTMLAARAGVKCIRLHDARHTHASLMLKQGVHPKIVQERLGHGSIQITLDTYSHVAPGLQEAAAARFDEIINPSPKNSLLEKSVSFR